MCRGVTVWCENNSSQQFNSRIRLEPVQSIVELNGKIVERTLSLSDFHGGDFVSWVAMAFD